MYFCSFSWVFWIIFLAGYTLFMFLWYHVNLIFFFMKIVCDSHKDQVCVLEWQSSLCYQSSGWVAENTVTFHGRIILQWPSSLWRALFRLTAPVIKPSADRTSLNWAPVNSGFISRSFCWLPVTCRTMYIIIPSAKGCFLIKLRVSGQPKP